MQPELIFDISKADPQGQRKAEQQVLAIEDDRARNGAPRRRPSAITWRFALLLGDSLLLMLLLFLLLPPPILDVRAPNSILGPWDAGFIWLCMVYTSWSLAVAITQAQQAHCAASVLKSPLYALCSLVLMLIFCTVLLYLFMESKAIFYIPLLLIFLLVAAPVFVIWRLVLAEIMHLPRFRRRALIVGANTAGRSVSRELLNANRPGANVIGYIDEGSDLQEQQDDVPVLGDRNTLRALVQNGMVDMVIMAIDYKANPELFQVALEAAQRGIALLPVTAIYEGTSGKIPVEYIGEQWYTSLPVEQVLTPLYLCWRKVIDLAFGVCGLLMLVLVFPLLAVLIYLDSPGKIFYSQERVGLRGKPFRIYKFRSMRADAEQDGNAIYASTNDNRVTRIGRFMRATHLDELPQVMNIIRGEMSLIGPRPEREEFVVQLEKTIPFYRCRLAAKPGLTGWAQVKYHYGSTDDETLIKLQYDLYYIKHQSFMLDIFIILVTFPEIFLCRGM